MTVTPPGGRALRFVFHYPETNGPEGSGLDAGPLLEVAVAAERAGFDAFSLSEHPGPGARWLSAGGHQTLDPLVALAAVAGATSRLRLVTNIVVAPYRNPLVLAKAAATLDLVSGGRLTLGLGSGYQKSEFFALGVDMEERNELFDEALEVLPLHWAGEPFSYAGRHFSARDVIARPRPVQDPIPIWIGGNSRRSRRRVAERAQGWMPMSGTAELSATGADPRARDARPADRHHRGAAGRGRRARPGADRRHLLVPRPLDRPAGRGPRPPPRDAGGDPGRRDHLGGRLERHDRGLTDARVPGGLRSHLPGRLSGRSRRVGRLRR